jgi:ribonucleoside-triphosphate reductase
MRGRAELERRLAELKGELGHVEGSQTEVYSRIVGYYRSVRNWNAGKREEYASRLAYAMPGTMEAAVASTSSGQAAGAAVGTAAAPAGKAAVAAGADRRPLESGAAPAPSKAARLDAGAPLFSQAVADFHMAAPERSGVLVFTRKACPNCPPVADFVTRAGLPAVFVDVDGDDGLALARRHGVLATPTVVGLDGEGHESFRAYGLAELKERLPGLELGPC